MSKNLRSKMENCTDSVLHSIAKECKTLAQIAFHFGFSNHGRNTSTVRDVLESRNIEYLHFTTGGKLKISEERICPQCSATFTVTLTDKKSASKITCGHACANVYFAWKQGSKNLTTGIGVYRQTLQDLYTSRGWVFKCCHCTEDRSVVVDIHHIDEDRSNNHLDNLVPLCVHCHRVFHKTEDLDIVNSIIYELDRR